VPSFQDAGGERPVWRGLLFSRGFAAVTDEGSFLVEASQVALRYSRVGVFTKASGFVRAL
jgi:hypothetical protein